MFASLILPSTDKQEKQKHVYPGFENCTRPFPGNRKYNQDSSFNDVAQELCEYAVLCENSYLNSWQAATHNRQPHQNINRKIHSEPQISQYQIDNAADYDIPLQISGWQKWSDFPSKETLEQAQTTGLFAEVLQKENRVLIVFRGTEFTSWKDWLSNLRWFHFLPFFKDQYTVTAEELGKEFVETFAKKGLHGCQIISTGHSLGGGLAQHFAYALPSDAPGIKAPVKVAKVYAFDPSPVTGWSTSGKIKHKNVIGLQINRVFEHGEILAYIRLLCSYVKPPSASDPSVREIRFNVVKTFNPFKNHSMRLLAVALMNKSR